MDRLQGDYAAWAQQDIDGLRTALEEARNNPDDQGAAIAALYTHALELKGQGGGFGYDLITAVGDLLNKFMEGRESVEGKDFEIIAAHIDAMQAVIRDRIKGNGGKVGMKIVEGLHLLVQG